MSEHSVPRAPTVDEIRRALAPHVVYVHAYEINSAVEDVAALYAPVLAENTWLRDALLEVASAVEEIPAGVYPVEREADERVLHWAEKASTIARAALAAVNSDQADTAVSTDRGEIVNSAVPQVTDGLVDELLQIGARYGLLLRDDMIHEQAAVKVRDVLVRYAGQGPTLTSEFRAVLPRWDGSDSSRGTWPRLDYALREAQASDPPGRVEVREATPWRDLDEGKETA